MSTPLLNCRDSSISISRNCRKESFSPLPTISPALVAQGRTVTEATEIARDVVRKLLEAQAERRISPTLPIIGDSFDCALVVGV